MAGLISRFVWIWPTWDSDRSSKATPHETQMVELGWFMVDGGGTTADFCRCESVVAGNAGTMLRRCVYNNATTDDETTMSPERCHVITSYSAEYVSADHVVDQMTSSPGWIAADDVDGLIIDVDEDFFGCDSRSDQLAGCLGNGFSSWRNVELVDGALSAFLCPRSAEDESAADRLARRLVDLVATVCRRRDTDRCGPPVFDAVVTSAFVSRPSMFCGTTTARAKMSWAALAEILVRVPLAHLRCVLDVGFCLNTAPRTHNFGQEPNVGDFVVCYGANEPNSTLVYLHSPSVDELDAQMRSFDRLVAELLRQAEARTARMAGDERRAVLVTVCRSIRDGYTPRSLAARIEDGILSALRRQRRSGAMTIVYDRDLLGGRGGWSSRP